MPSAQGVTSDWAKRPWKGRTWKMRAEFQDLQGFFHKGRERNENGVDEKDTKKTRSGKKANLLAKTLEGFVPKHRDEMKGAAPLPSV